MKVLSPFVMTVLVVAVASTPQSRPQRPRPLRPDELAAAQQSTNGKRKPPPPPGAENGKEGQTLVDVPAKSNTRWIWDDNCKDDRPPFQLGRWIQVRHDECPIAFWDPDFDFHENFCE